jgi:hypothetical protein
LNEGPKVEKKNFKDLR